MNTINRFHSLVLAASAILAMNFILPQAASAQALIIADDFNGTALNTNVWSVFTPACDSEMYVTNGNAVFVNRGQLLTRALLPSQIVVQGQFQLAGNSFDQFAVYLRTDGSKLQQQPYYFQTGIVAIFQVRSGDQGQTGVSNVKLDDITANTLITAHFPLAMNTYYQFKIIDSGTNVVLYLNDLINPLLTMNTTNRAGYRLGLQNREGDCAGSSISAGSVTELDYIDVSALGTPLSISVAAFNLNWFAMSNVNYQVQWSTNLQTWTALTNVIGAGYNTNIVDWVSGPRRFYRLTVQ